MSCISEPISWLRLERYHLGQLDAAERARVAEHLLACPACGACLAHLAAGDAVALPPLKVVPLRPWARLRPTLGALAAAAALLVVSRAALPLGGELGTRVKGAEVAF